DAGYERLDQRVHVVTRDPNVRLEGMEPLHREHGQGRMDAKAIRELLHVRALGPFEADIVAGERRRRGVFLRRGDACYRGLAHSVSFTGWGCGPCPRRCSRTGRGASSQFTRRLVAVRSRFWRYAFRSSAAARTRK